jgi:hypothetical protein
MVSGSRIFTARKTGLRSQDLRPSAVFYRKAVLACAGRVWHEVAFEYPTQNQENISEFVSRAAKAVQNSEDQGCEESVSPTVGETPALQNPTALQPSSGDWLGGSRRKLGYGRNPLIADLHLAG